MKKIIIALFAVLGVATSVSAQKFGHVDTQAIMQSLPEVTKANGELQATAQQYENELKTMQDEIQRKAEEYDKQKATMNATQQQAAEQDLPAGVPAAAAVQGISAESAKHPEEAGRAHGPNN